jgi:hypothetical protein
MKRGEGEVVMLRERNSLGEMGGDVHSQRKENEKKKKMRCDATDCLTAGCSAQKGK